MAKRLRDLIYQSPAAKTAIPLLCAVGTAVAGGFLVNEMTTPTGIEWGSFYRKPSFYAFLCFVILTYLFHRYLYVHEKDVLNFKDADYCRAYALSQLIPAHIEATKADIANGQTDKFKQAMDQINKAAKK